MTMLVFVAALRLFSSCVKQGLLQLRCLGCSLQCLLLQSTGFGARSLQQFAARGLSSCDCQAREHRFNGCGAQA